jgi:all-trans-retinol 13,14-reductase
MDVGLSYKQKQPAGPFDAIVIGSGMGGLTAAAALARQHHRRVLVLERHYTAGGFTHSFTRPGYEWDVGVHYIGQVGPGGVLRAPFDWLTEGRLDWAKMPDVYDRVYLGDRSYDYVTGARRFIERMVDYFPRERVAIESYVALVKQAARAGAGFAIDRTLPAPVSRLIGPLLRAPLLRHASRTTAEVLGELTADRELRAVLAAQWGDYGLPPSQSSFAMHATVANHYLGGGYFPVGGASAIARGIAPLIEREGGQIFVNAEVREIVVERGRAVGVRMADDREIRAPVIISNAGAMNTFERLVPRDHAPRAVEQQVREVGASVSYVCLYLGLKHTDEELGLTGTNLWIYPDSDYDSSVARFLADPSAPFPLVFASFPSAKDPSFRDRHPGHSTVDVIVPAKYEWFSRWEGTRWRKRGPEYNALKEQYTARVLDVLFARVPALRGKIDVAELSTPLSTQHFSAYARGELYGLDHSPARYRLPLRARTELPGLFLTGQDLVSCGVSAAMFSGFLTAAAIAGPAALIAAMRRR